MEKLKEPVICDKVIDFLVNKVDGNWHEKKVEKSELHHHGVDIKLVGGKKNSEYFYIECKGKSYAKSADSVNKEGWLNAMGQLITRMTVKPNHAYKYGLGLYSVSAKVALRRIPKKIASALNLYIFACDDNGKVVQFSPKDFGKDYSDDKFSSFFVNK